mmetsp:Transcript_50362/g.155703  ORF Transcript_50362/g.155703 Transcript_50362/m.155703 type:complete len:390 (+) Transcript_50362:112-1281(+)|eukprot:CAMPEP_0204566866 /NCGR_PEP_ID=MMETSP0661-20131031/36278_1 /ASSEMBLY_ACC=CAM_ASM_000606 /TAXON_ID=109239 /ORGANISM="Alexandrium margalefi, Strain AMGDE01CS-322" /LENGTH=389 /DNA_ID=CAMNT_0051574731 /DNA_START=112 /DNA_END=1281 /DNA_ORIENTATION=+
MPPDQELRKAVDWLNSEGCFFDSLDHEKISGAAAGLPWAVVQAVVNLCVDRRDEVEDHTAFVCNGLAEEQKRPHDGSALRYWPSSGGGGGDGAAFSDREWELWERIRWMNTEGGFEDAIRYEDIAEAAAGLETASVMTVLSHLEEKWQEVNDPTSWVRAALVKERSGKGSRQRQGGGPRQGGQPGQWGPDDGIRQRVAWLNGEGGFKDALQYEQIAEAAWGVDVNFVMKVLNHVLDKKGEVKDPTSWVCAALAKEANSKGVKGWQKGSGGGGKEGGCGHWKAGTTQDVNREVRRRVAWLNNEGGFQNSIGYQEVADAAAGSEIHTVVKVFQNLQEKRHEIANPTAWVCAALCKEQWGGGKAKGKGYGKDGYGGAGKGRAPPVQKYISKK